MNVAIFGIITAMGRIRVFLLWVSDLMCISCTWAAVVWGYWAIGLGGYRPSFYLQVWPIGFVFTGLNALFRLYHGRPLYPAAPHSPVEEMRRLAGLADHHGYSGILPHDFFTLIWDVTADDYEKRILRYMAKNGITEDIYVYDEVKKSWTVVRSPPPPHLQGRSLPPK